MQYTCGHEGHEPRNMGRGAARQRRLAEYFDRPCLACAIVQADACVRRLTDRRGQPLPADVMTKKIEETRERVIRAYGTSRQLTT